MNDIAIQVEKLSKQSVCGEHQPSNQCFGYTAEQLPKITLVTPSYNQACYLSQTIQSVLDQHYPALEYFVMDGGSTDHSPQILRQYTNQLSGWVSRSDRGQADAINQGFAGSSGAILGWLNSDDLLWTGALIAIGAYFATHPEVDVVMGWSLFFREQHIWYLHEPLGLRLEYLLYSNYFLPQESVFWRRRVYEQIGELDLDLYVLDHDYFIRMALIGAHAAVLHRPIGGFRYHSQQKIANQKVLQQSQQQIQTNYLVKLGIAPAQVQQRRIYWGLHMKLDRAVRKLRRLSMEQSKTKKVVLESERYLGCLACQGDRFNVFSQR